MADNELLGALTKKEHILQEEIETISRDLSRVKNELSKVKRLKELVEEHGVLY